MMPLGPRRPRPRIRKASLDAALAAPDATEEQRAKLLALQAMNRHERRKLLALSILEAKKSKKAGRA